MVCDRCIMVVRSELTKLGLHPVKVMLGKVDLQEQVLSDEEQASIDKALLSFGFERIDDRKGRLVEAIKNKIIKMIHKPETDRKHNWSDVLSESMHYEYNYLSNLFSSLEGITLEQYIIRQKIERVKELLLYDEFTLSQISNMLGYSSVAHLSAQFKKVTGLSPSALKKSRQASNPRKPLDKISD